MKISKSMYLAVSVVGLFMQLPAHAAGNAHKYPVFVINPVPAKPVEAAGAKAGDAPSAKPVDPAVAKPGDAVVAVPIGAQGAKTSQVVSAPAPESIESKPIFTTRYGPLSDKGGIDVIPDFNRGRGQGK